MHTFATTADRLAAITTLRDIAATSAAKVDDPYSYEDGRVRTLDRYLANVTAYGVDRADEMLAELVADAATLNGDWMRAVVHIGRIILAAR